MEEIFKCKACGHEEDMCDYAATITETGKATRFDGLFETTTDMQDIDEIDYYCRGCGANLEI